MAGKGFRFLRMDLEGTPYETYDTLNEARAAVVQLGKEGKLDGAVIFKPRGFGFMIANIHDPKLPQGIMLYSGPRADFRPVLDNGSLMSQDAESELRRNIF